MKFMVRLILFVIILMLSISFSNAQENTSKVGPVFKDGKSQIVSAFNDPKQWIRHDLWVETAFDTDGDQKLDRVHVDVTRPQQTESEGLKLPVIYETSPYYAGVAGDAEGIFWNVNVELGEAAENRIHPDVKRLGKRPIISNSLIKDWVPRGFIVVHSSSPGTGLSQGAPTVGGDNESLAPKAVIDWLNGRAKGYTTPGGEDEVLALWSTGKVGMTGTSYNGTLPLAAATTGVKGLEVIIPVAPNTSYYHYYRSNGLIRSPGGYLGEDIDVLYDFIHSGDESKRSFNNKTVRDTEMINGMDRLTGDYNEFWAGRDYLNDMEPMTAAMLMSHSFNDWNVMPEHSYRIYKAAKEKGLTTHIYYHQNGHGGPPPMAMMNRWFTKYLHGLDNGIEKEENHAYIVREDDLQSNPTVYKDFPNPEASDVTLYLNAGGHNAGGLSRIQNKALIVERLVDDFNVSGKDLAMADHSKNRLLYLTPILKEDLHISGLANISISLSSNKPAANLSVWLVALPWEGGKITNDIITRGWADPQNYKSLTTSKPLEVDRTYTLNFDLQPDDQIIKAGQQIGLMIFSSDKEFTLHPTPGTELSIHLAHTMLKLPVVGGKEAYKKATN